VKKSLSILTAFFGLLLRLYPRDFREDFYEEMYLDFADTVEVASKRGMASLLVALLRELRDFPIGLLGAYLIKERMFNLFQPESMQKIFRVALAFGLTLAIANMTGIAIFAVMEDQVVVSMIQEYCIKMLGALLAGLMLPLILREVRQIKRYLLVGIVIWMFPDILNRIVWEFTKSSHSTLLNGIIGIGYMTIMGFAMGFLFSLALQDRQKTPWLIFVGGAGYFLASWAYAFMIWRFDPYISYDPFSLQGFLSMTIRYITMGATVGALLGVVSVWSRQKATLA
jgi:hypothetical protein